MAKRMFRQDLKAVLLAFSVFVSAVIIAIPVFAQENTVGTVQTEATQSVVRDQLDAFKSGDHQRAYSHAAPSIKGYFKTVDRFIGMVKSGYSAIYESESFVMGRNTLIGGQVHQEVIITDPQGKQWQAVYTLREQEDGTWKITGVKMEPFKGATT